jgi:hypothetical protein
MLFSDRMPASFRKQQNIPPFEKGGSGGISIFYIPALSTTTRYIFSITASVSAITSRLLNLRSRAKITVAYSSDVLCFKHV